MQWSILLLNTFLLLSETPLLANEEKSRQVIGGDLIHTAKATAQTQELALFKAEAEAICRLTIECGGFPHRDIVIYETHVDSDQSYFTATVQAGINFQSCEQGRKATQSVRTRLTNPDLVRRQQIYEELLTEEMKLPSGRQKELKELIKNEFTSIRSQINELQHNLKTIPIVVNRTQIIELQQSPIPANAQTFCFNQYKTLMSQAESAALGNIPPGNLAQGMALTYYNQAQSILRNCQ